MQSQNFKPDYAGQPAHGAIPKAGIDMTNMIATIGDANLNEFEKLNTGIVAKSSILTVKRSKFTNIGYDMFYTEPYRGTAMVSVGMPTGDIHTGSLTVLPEAITYNTVDNCYRGIYVNKSALYADYIHILNVTQGVYGTQTTLLQTSMVSNCTITTSGTGIFWVNNPLAKAMMAIGNNITVNASVMPPGLAKRMSRGAIYAGETTLFKPVVYTLNNNNIQLSNAFYGIMNNAALNSKIKENMIRISQSSGNADVTGIELNSSYNANVSCNTIKGDYAGGSAGNTYSIYVTQSTRANISCNTADSTYRGIFFGGVSPQTNLKGNEMSNQFNGLYLNNQAVIWPQPHRGNVWNGPFGSFGAVNMNFAGILGSPFYVDSLLISVYKPTVNISNWFLIDSGSTYYCWQQPTMCNNAPPALLSLDSLEIMIANGTLESEEYVDETRAITEEYLYRTLSEDSALWQEDSSYVTFMTENMGEPTEYLYNAEEYMRAAYSYDSVFVNLIDSAYSQMELFSDSINLIDEWQNINPDANADSMLQVWTYKIDFLNQTINNLKVQQEASINDNLANAELKNDYVVNAELPEMNTAFMNEVEINYIERGNDIQYLIDNFSDILAIAQQCPYAGGNAVIRARVWLSMINDSIDYNDNAICLQSGIYRIANIDIKSDKTNDEIIIQPNPAGDYITVTTKSVSSENCKLEIINNLNQVVLAKQLACNNQEKIDVSKINQGLYAVKIFLNNGLTKIQKLIITR
ncbi:MAG: T9SS type A sorting domain-containing protein [Bacteroidetes bacterium]|nr:T9SS type A sorting domain-containing protein [Bacteroidota bacterium]